MAYPTQEEMIEALLAQVDGWETDMLIDYVVTAERARLEADLDTLKAEYSINILGE